MLIVSAKDVALARKPKHSDLLNKVLYDLARKFPDHKKEEHIYAKVVIIGRTYSVALERGAGHDKAEGKFYADKIIPAIKGSPIDELIRKSKKLKKITTKNLEMILDTHKAVTDILREETDMCNRSFVSKYLHFHCKNAFFIYDSIAKDRLSELASGLAYEYTLTGEASTDTDKEYERFCLKCLALRDEIEEKHQVLLTPRELDNLLLQK